MTQPSTPDSPNLPSVTETTHSADNIDAHRRRLGLGIGAGVLATLASRPVLATCNTPSAAASGNLSQHGTPPSCSGCLSLSGWLSLNLSGTLTVLTTLFGEPFPTAGNQLLNLSTLLTVMTAGADANASIEAQLRAEFCVAYLNILQSPMGCDLSQFLSSAQLTGIWTEYATTGTYCPKAGTVWSPTQLLAYLRGLHGI